ncbi:hypothetical protein P167DRAFT_608737 [Morchella conica CCBAS932]|uniref:Uncharacterized protein n=1 Tax=Morchella conica CCBAS932 TaxID=1392247 RepID=A0A3N4KG53_9PEZI|nr:hypothetical protein P167DRAFT_608737 [Morchella conica CCBAS932]
MADADSDSNSTVELHRDDDLALELERFGDRNRGARGHSNTSLLSQEVHDYGSVCIDSVRLPFLADSIRQDAVYHYGCIKELQSPKNPDTGSGSESSGFSGSIVLVESYKEMEAERLRSLTIFRDLLLADLTSLLDKIQELENKLLGRKERYQIASRIHCGLGLGLVGMSAHWFKPLILKSSSYDHYLMSYRSEIRKICTIFTAIGVYTLYTLHSAHRYRKAMASTSNMRKEIARFVRKVEKKQHLVDKDIEGLKGAKWDEVPWKEVETEPSWKLLSGL